MKLVPEYVVDADMLAGISGDRKRLRRALRDGSADATNYSSWVYWPGLSDTNDDRIALIWESRAGIAFNGARFHGHAVGFVGGNFTQIPDGEWDAFVAMQRRLREESKSAPP